MAKGEPGAWQKVAWIVGFIVAATSVGLIPKLTDLQTVAAAEAAHKTINEKVDRQYEQIMFVLDKIYKKVEKQDGKQ